MSHAPPGDSSGPAPTPPHPEHRQRADRPSRDLARTAADSATDVLHPLITITRGLRRLAAAGRRKWADTPKDRRGPLLFLVASVVLVVALVPYGPLLAVISLMAAAAWQGRDRAPSGPRPDEDRPSGCSPCTKRWCRTSRSPRTRSPLRPRRRVGQGLPRVRVRRHRPCHAPAIRYPAYFTDGEADSRARIEQLLHAKSGRGREYHFAWDEEGNQLDGRRVLPPLPTDIAAQRFVTAPGETVLGFTDPEPVQRTLPPPTAGRRVTSRRSSGARAPLHRAAPAGRRRARQRHDHPAALDRPPGPAVRRRPDRRRQRHRRVRVPDRPRRRTGRRVRRSTGPLASLEWAAHETERRLIAANRARQAGRPVPDDTRRPLWILLDRPAALAHLAAADGGATRRPCSRCRCGTAGRRTSRWWWPNSSTARTP